jgi:hypothetical protein
MEISGHKGDTSAVKQDVAAPQSVEFCAAVTDGHHHHHGHGDKAAKAAAQQQESLSLEQKGHLGALTLVDAAAKTQAEVQGCPTGKGSLAEALSGPPGQGLRDTSSPESIGLGRVSAPGDMGKLLGDATAGLGAAAAALRGAAMGAAAGAMKDTATPQKALEAQK